MFFTFSHMPTENPPTYVVKDLNDEIIQGKFNEPESLSILYQTQPLKFKRVKIFFSDHQPKANP